MATAYRFQPAGQALAMGDAMTAAYSDEPTPAGRVYAYTDLGQIASSEATRWSDQAGRYVWDPFGDDEATIEVVAFTVDGNYARIDGYEGEIVMPGAELFRVPAAEFLARYRAECPDCGWACLVRDGKTECCGADLR